MQDAAEAAPGARTGQAREHKEKQSKGRFLTDRWGPEAAAGGLILIRVVGQMGWTGSRSGQLVFGLEKRMDLEELRVLEI